jgi:hypothetical protein
MVAPISQGDFTELYRAYHGWGKRLCKFALMRHHAGERNRSLLCRRDVSYETLVPIYGRRSDGWSLPEFVGFRKITQQLPGGTGNKRIQNHQRTADTFLHENHSAQQFVQTLANVHMSGAGRAT